MNTRFEHSLGYVVNRTALQMRQGLSAAFRAAGHDVTHAEWTILDRLGRRDGEGRRELADATARDSTTVTRLLDGMVRKGLVRRREDTRDRRIVRAWLTARGKRLAGELSPIAAAFSRESTRGVSGPALDATLATLGTVQANLRRMEVDGTHSAQSAATRRASS